MSLFSSKSKKAEKQERSRRVQAYVQQNAQRVAQARTSSGLANRTGEELGEQYENTPQEERPGMMFLTHLRNGGFDEENMGNSPAKGLFASKTTGADLSGSPILQQHAGMMFDMTMGSERRNFQLDYSPERMLKEGGKASFKLFGKTDYGKILSSFSAFHSLPEESIDDIKGKRKTLAALAAQAEAWLDKHRAYTGNDAMSSGEEKKAKAVSDLALHLRVQDQMLSGKMTKLEREEQALRQQQEQQRQQQWQQSLDQYVTESRDELTQQRDKLKTDENPNPSLSFQALRGDDSKLITGMKALGRDISASTLIPIAKGILSTTMQGLAGGIKSGGIQVDTSIGGMTGFSIQAEHLIPHAKQIINALLGSVPDELLDVIAASSLASESFNFVDSSGGLANTDMLTISNLMLRFICPAVTTATAGFAPTDRIADDQMVLSNDAFVRRGTFYNINQNIAAAYQFIANGVAPGSGKTAGKPVAGVMEGIQGDMNQKYAELLQKINQRKIVQRQRMSGQP